MNRCYQRSRASESLDRIWLHDVTRMPSVPSRRDGEQSRTVIKFELIAVWLMRSSSRVISPRYECVVILTSFLHFVPYLIFPLLYATLCRIR